MMGFLRSILVFVAGLFAGRKTRPERKVPVPRSDPRPFWIHGWRGFAKRFLFVIPFLALLGFLLAASGIIAIKASSGHFAITAWFLEFSMARSVSTHSMGISAPPLDDPALVVKGAGHYETGCRPCHGGVSDVHPRIPQAMTPHPPMLPDAVPEWDAEELFYIVKHGVKFTGMPAFPALERDDEVWAVVAFLLRLPEMSVTEYQRLVYGETLGEVVLPSALPDTADALGSAAARAADNPAEGGAIDTTEGGAADTAEAAAVDTAEGAAIDTTEGTAIDTAEGAAPISQLPTGSEPVAIAETCRRCHGVGGQGRENSAYPRLAGQRPDYIYAALFAYASGERHSGMMEPIAAGLTAEEMREIALYYAQAGVRPALGVRTPDAEGRLDQPPVVEARGDTTPGADSVGGRDLPAVRRDFDAALDHPDGPLDPDTAIEPRTWRQEATPETTMEEVDESVEASLARGREIARRGIPMQKVPACQDCHGPNRVRMNPFYPVLAGQYAEYLLLQLELFKAGRRGGSSYAHLMRPTAEKLTKQQMKDVALYYQSLGGEEVSGIAPYVEGLVPTKH